MDDCGCSLPVRDFLESQASRFGLGPMPYGKKCSRCHGVFSDREIEDRSRWYYELLTTIRKKKKGALVDKEESVWRALRHRFGGTG